MNSPIWASRAMDCGLNDYAPEGKPVHEIVEELASDNEHFAKVFLGKGAFNNYVDKKGWVGGQSNVYMK